MKTPPGPPPAGKHDPDAPVSLRDAARMANVPREYLEECIASGKLAVHLRQKGEITKLRVSRAALESAGIVPKELPPPVSDPNETLVRLLQAQTERLAAIEEQRFQLAGQLGAALERNRMLEERVLALAAASETDESIDPPARKTAANGVDESEEARAPSAEPSPLAPVMLADRIIRLKPPARWPSRAFGSIPALRSLLGGKRGDPI